MRIAWVKHAPGSERLPHIYTSQSLNREALNGHRRLYQTIMYGPSELTRAEREAMAVTVSAINDCHY